MITALDSSAAASIFVAHPASQAVTRLVDEADEVVTSALCRTELSVALTGNAPTGPLARQWADELGRMWQRFWTIPVDQECLDLAADLAIEFQLPIPPLLPLAAFARIAGPVQLLSLDSRQVAPAVSLGLRVVKLEASGSAHAMLRS